ncbi:N-acetylglucosamine kinase [Oceanicoccus sp. KOV_DT_Chl]|uniref:N-acetylglucosamine kinase n=1 Tax=Oceanicoccus sp. KOV_DT_Chl TaxID=1904639 RepID=UPI000C7B8EDB|nr:BadF/BadG/BcrA/BcrD ATPase family protein [Oceanicoccus sp. KOV_DT_Chl]
MNSAFKNERTIYLGIDGGGSKCKARVVDEKFRVLGSAVAGPANPVHGIEQAIESIQSSAQMALLAAGFEKNDISQVVAGVGLAGVNLPSLYQVMQEWQHPFKRLFLTTDLHIACLGAHGGEEGAVMVAGTGSCGYIYSKNKTAIYGAHGFPAGDKGSGAWLGLEAMKAVLLAQDGLAEATQLTELLSAKLGTKGLGLVEVMVGASPRKYAQLAPLVIEAAEKNDAVAVGIIRDGACYLSMIARKLLADNPARLSLLGGLSERLMPWMDQDVVGRFSSPLDQPEAGAIYFAKKEMEFWRAAL